MPTVCAEHGCPILVHRGYCQAHTPKRTSGGARGYGQGGGWRNTRAAYLAANPMCATPGCTKTATDVHHRDGQGPRGPRGHDWTNLEGHCHAHHSRITALEHGLGSLPAWPSATR